MASRTTVKGLADKLGDPDDGSVELEEEEVRLAAAVLLVHATAVDGQVVWRERQALHDILERGFELDQLQVRQLVTQADEKEKKTVDLHGITGVLTKKLNKEDRMKVLEMLFEVINADGVIYDEEGKFALRVEQSLGVTSHDWAKMRMNKEDHDA